MNIKLILLSIVLFPSLVFSAGEPQRAVTDAMCDVAFSWNPFAWGACRVASATAAYPQAVGAAKLAVFSLAVAAADSAMNKSEAQPSNNNAEKKQESSLAGRVAAATGGLATAAGTIVAERELIKAVDYVHDKIMGNDVIRENEKKEYDRRAEESLRIQRDMAESQWEIAKQSEQNTKQLELNRQAQIEASHRSEQVAKEMRNHEQYLKHRDKLDSKSLERMIRGEEHKE